MQLDIRAASTPYPILVVEDFHIMRKLNKRLLERIGYTEIPVAETGEEALEMIEADKNIRLVLLDWNLPGVSGLGVLRTLRRLEGGALVKVVMCTSESDQTHVLEAMAAGTDSYIVKPFKQETLTEKLKSVLEKEIVKSINQMNQHLKKIQSESDTDIGENQKKLARIYLVAVQEILGANRYFPFVPDGLYQAGKLLLLAGRSQDALASFEEALHLAPLHNPTRIALARLYLSQLRPDEAIEVLKPVSGDEADYTVLEVLGEAYLAKCYTSHAIACFQKSIKHAEKQAGEKKIKQEERRRLALLHDGLGRAFDQMFDTTKEKPWQKKSIQSFCLSIEVDPTYISAHFNLIEAYQKAGMQEKADEVAKRIFEISPVDSGGWFSLGKIFFMQHNPTRASFAFLRAIEKAENPASIYYDVGDFYSSHEGHYEEALDFLLKSLAIDAQQPHVLNKAGILYRRLNQPRKAIECYERALNICLDSEAIYYNLARAYLATKDKEGVTTAKEFLARGLEIHPLSERIANLLDEIEAAGQ